MATKTIVMDKITYKVHRQAIKGSKIVGEIELLESEIKDLKEMLKPAGYGKLYLKPHKTQKVKVIGVK